MPEKATTDVCPVLSGIAAIVYLYLLHYPDYIYHIAKCFVKMLPSGVRRKRREPKYEKMPSVEEIKERKKKGKPNFPLSLTEPSNLSKYLTLLTQAKLLIIEEKKRENDAQNKDKIDKIYRADIEKILPLASIESIKPRFYIDLYTEIVPKETILKMILSYKKRDILTIYLHIREILSTLLIHMIDIFERKKKIELAKVTTELKDDLLFVVDIKIIEKTIDRLNATSIANLKDYSPNEIGVFKTSIRQIDRDPKTFGDMTDRLEKTLIAKLGTNDFMELSNICQKLAQVIERYIEAIDYFSLVVLYRERYS